MAFIIDPYKFGTSAPVVQNKTVDIYTGGTSYLDTDAYTPSVGNSYYETSATHVIVQANDLNALDSGAKLITGIDVWICAGGSSGGYNTDPDYGVSDLSTFLAHTSESIMITGDNMKTDMSQSQSTFAYDVASRVAVKSNFSIPVQSTAGWYTINFNFPYFVYDGTSNLVFSFYRNDNGYQTGRRTSFAYGNVGGARSATNASDGWNANPATNAFAMQDMDAGYSYQTMNMKVNY